MSQEVVNLLLEPARERVELLRSHDLLRQLRCDFQRAQKLLCTLEPQTFTGVRICNIV